MDRNWRIVLSGLFLALCFVPGVSGSVPVVAQQWRPVEVMFSAETEIADPFDLEGANFVAAFTASDGTRLDIPGFWDGERTWKIRFTPTRSGRWTYVTRFANPKDKGLHGKTGELAVKPGSGTIATQLHGGFLKPSTDGRSLTYTDGTPFFWLGDTWWAVPSANVPFDVFKRQVDARLPLGYTIFQAHGHRPIFPDSQIGAFEAVRKPDAETLRYWRETDRYLVYACEKGMIGMMGFGRGDMFDPLSMGELKRLWRYYIARYGAFPVSFLITQEYNIDVSTRGQHIPKLLAVGQFIKDTDPYKRAMTAHPWCRSRDSKQSWDQPWQDFIMLQAGHRRFESAKAYQEIWQRTPPRAFLEAEANYEGFASADFEVNAAAIRRSAYTAVQSGSFGFTYGAQGLYAGILDRTRPGPTARWGPVLTGEEALSLAGGLQLRHLRACYESVPWWKLSPLPDAVEPAATSVIVKGEPPSLFLIYYIPTKGPLKELCLTQASKTGRYEAHWFDPRTGNQSSAGDLRPADKGFRLPSPPDNQDWMLILRWRES